MSKTTPARLIMSNVWANWVPDPATMADLVDAWVNSSGLNGCGLQIPWRAIEWKDGEFEWDWLDERLDLIAEAGLRCHLRLATQNHRPGWVGSELMRDSSGRIAAGYDWTMLSFADPLTGRYVSRALGEIAKHVQERYADMDPHPVTCILPQFSGMAETEYWHDMFTDFSEVAQSDFRTWLQGEFESLDELNACWGSKHGDWARVALQGAHPWSTQRYRTWRLAALIRQCADAVHAGGAQMAVQFGSIWDGLSSFRCTQDTSALIEPVDWIVVDDAPHYDHFMSMDYLRGHARDKVWGNEVDGAGCVTYETGLAQAVESLRRGAHFIFAANWNAKAHRDPAYNFWPQAMEEAAQPRPEIVPSRAILLSLATIYHKEPLREIKDLFYDLWLALTDGGGKPVDIITDTVLLLHPDWIDQYSDGLFIPASQRWMARSLFEALERSPVPVYAEGDSVGSLDEYGRGRPAGRLPWSAVPADI